MKKSFSFNKLLHNEKLMMVCALILGIVVWQSVVFGPSNEESKSIAQIPVNVTITNAYAQQNDLRIIGTTAFYATVQVNGLRSVITQLNSTDFTLSADTTNITTPGVYQLAVKMARSSTNYDVISVSPSVIEVTTVTAPILTAPFMMSAVLEDAIFAFSASISCFAAFSSSLSCAARFARSAVF